MAILALSGSSSSTSLNRRLLEWAASLSGREVELVSVIEFPAPIFSVDLEATDGIPASMQGLYDRLHAADALMLALPEHNGGPPSMFKNALDWVSRIDRKVFAMPTLLLSTSPGPRGGVTNLEHFAKVMPWWGTTVVGHHSLGRFHDAFGDNGPSDATFVEAVTASVRALEAAIEET